MAHRLDLKNVSCLLLGAVLAFLANGNRAVAAAAWLFPLLFLVFIRRQPSLRGLPIGWLAFVTALLLAWRGAVPMHGLMYLLSVAGLATVAYLAFVADRLLSPRLGDLAASLVFPVFWTALEYLVVALSPFGSSGSLAYSQAGQLPLLQLLSVTGLSGVSFLVTWFSSTAATVWLRRDNPRRCFGAAVVWAVVLTIVLVGGGMRLAAGPATQPTVRVAAITGQDFHPLFRDPDPWRDRPAFATRAAGLVDGYFAASEREAAAGAKIIVWSEVAGLVTAEQEAALVQRAQAFARDHHVYLALPLYIVPEQPGRSVNKALLIDPSGDIVLEHFKYGANLIETDRLPGAPVITSVDTPYGRLGLIICWDADFFAVMRQAGLQGVDILLDPASDWRDVDPYHSTLAEFRAIENGFALVKPTMTGLSVATDHRGRVLAAVDYFASPATSLVAEVPVRGVRTFYARMGDLVAWLSLAAAAGMIGLAVVRRRRAA